MSIDDPVCIHDQNQHTYNNELGRRRTITTFEKADRDSFGRLRVSNPFVVFDSLLISDKQNLLWDEALAGAGTSIHVPNESAVVMTVGTASGDSVIRQTREFFRYNAGKSQFVLMTGTLGTQKANVRQRIGAFYEDNGLFFEQDGSNLKVVIRSKTSGSVVDVAVNQSKWNLDTFDGNVLTNPSGITLDTSKTQIFVIDYQWLGVGKVRFGFSFDGLVKYCHEIENANIRAAPYMSTGNLPCRYEIENTGIAASSSTMLQICASVSSEGGFTPQGSRFFVNSGLVSKTVLGTSTLPMVSVRLKSTHIRSRIILDTLTVLSASNKDFLFEIILNGTLTGAAWTSINADSISEMDNAATAISGGIAVEGGFVGGNMASAHIPSGAFQALIQAVASFGGTPDILTLTYTNLNAPSIECYGSMSIKEVI